MVNLYETDFPGMYMTEDGYYVTESGDIYDEEGTLLELGTAEVVPIKAGAGLKTIEAQPVRDAIRNNLGRAARFVQNHKGKAALGVAGVGLAAYGAKKAYNHFKNKKKAANESFDIY